MERSTAQREACRAAACHGGTSRVVSLVKNKNNFFLYFYILSGCRVPWWDQPGGAFGDVNVDWMELFFVCLF